MSWFKRTIDHHTSRPEEPPAWAPAIEPSRTYGIYNEAPEQEFMAAEDFCRRNPVYQPRILPSSDVQRIQEEGCKAWDLLKPALQARFKGTIDNGSSAKNKVVEVLTAKDCGDSCIMSNFPILAGLYDNQGKEGVYYEITIKQMDGIIAIGTACQPYPEYRFPGWNRLSAGLHLDDMQKFFEDPNGGRSYDSRLQRIRPGDVIGCGYEFSTASLFYTYNGERLDTAFRGIYLPREAHDVYAAVGVGGPGANHFVVNFGGDDTEYLFRWKPAREWAWRVEGHVGRLGGGSGSGEQLPSYYESV